MTTRSRFVCQVFHWRKPEVITIDPDTNARHVAHYRVQKRDRRVVIEQHFDENFDPKFDRQDYHCRSAVAVQVLGEGVVVEEPGDRRLYPSSRPPGEARGQF